MRVQARMVAFVVCDYCLSASDGNDDWETCWRGVGTDALGFCSDPDLCGAGAGAYVRPGLGTGHIRHRRGADDHTAYPEHWPVRRCLK